MTTTHAAAGDAPLHDPGSGPPVAALVGQGLPVPCLDGVRRPYADLDAAASTSALPAVAERVADVLPWYSSVHRGAGHKSQLATAAYERARADILAFAGRDPDRDTAILCRNTTEAVNHLAHRLRLDPADVVVSTAVEHHANLLPWARVATRRFVECGLEGTFDLAAVVAALDARPAARLLAVTGASNITGWLPPVGAMIAEAHARGVPVLVDGAQRAPHLPLPPEADFVAFSGHKMYAPYGAGALIGPRDAFADGEPFLAGGGAVEFVSLDEVIWTSPPEREEAGSPNVLGALALGTAAAELPALGWDRIAAHDRALAQRLRGGLAAIGGVRLLGPGLEVATLPIATFLIEGVPHALAAARLSAEFGVGVRHGCFCAHPYLQRLLGLDAAGTRRFRDAAVDRDRRGRPGAVRASAGIATTIQDVDRLLEGVAAVASGPPPVEYLRDAGTGEAWPAGFPRPAEPGRGGSGESS
ncbi:aminotransferase class V-fold PLP-dependent enzyme [Baekduia soli]|nr:aminotransferase class V-fold PLP-dependent enzyme [Baekduia soli]